MRVGSIVAGLVVGGVTGWLAVAVAVIETGRVDRASSADAIVVLGAAQYEGHPSPVLRARLDHAVELWRERLAPMVVVTGGTGIGDTVSEAAVGRRYLLQHGVPDTAIAVEARGTTTSESLHAVRRLLGAMSSPRVVLVSDPFHMLRLSIISRRLAMVPLISPTRTSPISLNKGLQWRYVLSESLKVPFVYFTEHRN